MLIGLAIKIAKSKKVRRLAKTAAKQAAKQVKVTRTGDDIVVAVGSFYKVSAKDIKDTIASRKAKTEPQLAATTGGWDDDDWFN